jgi:hypothetical protein
MEKPSEGRYVVNVYPEFAGRSLRSLLLDLLQVLPETTPEERDEKQRVSVAYDRARLLPTLYVLATKDEKLATAGSSDEAPALIRNNLKTLMTMFFDLNRWGKPFTWEKKGKRLKLPDADTKNDNAAESVDDAEN